MFATAILIFLNFYVQDLSDCDRVAKICAKDAM